MEKIVKINSFQIFFIMFLSRIILTLTYIPALNITLNSSDNLVDIGISFVGILIASIPTMLLLKTKSRANILNRCACVSPAFGRISAIIYSLGFIYFALMAIIRFNLFITTVVFPQSNSNIFIILVIIVCIAAALLGLEALGRSGTLIFSIIVISLIVIFASVSPSFEWLNFSPILDNGVKPVLQSSVATITRTIEMAMILILMPNIKGNIKKGLFWWIVGICLSMFIVVFYIAGVLGEYSETQMFPAYTLTIIAKLGFLQRIDVLLTSTWILCIFIKVSIILYLIKECLKVGISQKYDKAYIICSGVIITILSFFIKPTATNIGSIFNINISIAIFLLIIIIIPIVLLICEKVKERKINEN